MPCGTGNAVEPRSRGMNRWWRYFTGPSTRLTSPTQ